jgi:hypothetical protein
MLPYGYATPIILGLHRRFLNKSQRLANARKKRSRRRNLWSTPDYSSRTAAAVLATAATSTNLQGAHHGRISHSSSRSKYRNGSGVDHRWHGGQRSAQRSRNGGADPEEGQHRRSERHLKKAAAAELKPAAKRLKQDRRSRERHDGKSKPTFKEYSMAGLVTAAAGASTVTGLASITAGMAANEALSAAEMAAQIQKKANTAAVNAI